MKNIFVVEKKGKKFKKTLIKIVLSKIQIAKLIIGLESINKKTELKKGNLDYTRRNKEERESVQYDKKNKLFKSIYIKVRWENYI